MARIRTIKPEFFKHGELYDAEKHDSLPLRLAFAGLWCQCDREGRFPWKPRELKLDVLPYDECDFSRVLDALASRGFVVKYASDGKNYGWIPSFGRHQVVNNRESLSVLPEPNEINTIDASVTREGREDHAPVGEGKGRERKGREGKAPEVASLDLPIWLPKDTWEAFIEMRKRIKKPPTDFALKLILKKLQKGWDDGFDSINSIEASISANWQDVFFNEKTPRRKIEYRDATPEDNPWKELGL